MKRIRYIEKTLKQDETVQTPLSVLVTKQGETKCNNETDTFLSQEFFFLAHFCVVTNETRYIEKIRNRMKQTKNHGHCLLPNKAKHNETMKQIKFINKPISVS